MNRPTFEQTIDILVQAYLKGTLMHGDCSACAVGNIVGSSLKCKVEGDRDNIKWMRNGEEIEPAWDRVFLTSDQVQDVWPYNYNGVSKIQIDETGYSLYELASIELAFESVDEQNDNEGYYNSENHMYEGLMAVVDTLARIHNVDLSVKESAKAVFVK